MRYFKATISPYVYCRYSVQGKAKNVVAKRHFNVTGHYKAMHGKEKLSMFINVFLEYDWAEILQIAPENEALGLQHPEK